MLKNKVVLLAPLPPPFGGMASWTETLVKKFPEPDKLIVSDSAVHGRAVSDVSLFSRLRAGIVQAFRDSSRTLKLLKTSKTSVLHICTSGSLAFFKDAVLTFIAARRGHRVLVHMHFGRIPTIIQRGNWEFKLLKFIQKHAAVILVLDQQSLEALQKIGAQNVQKIPNYIDLKGCGLQVQGILDEPKNGEVMYAGHILKSKGIEDLLAACRLAGITGAINLYGVGEKDYCADLQKEFSDLQLIFHGRVERSEVIQAMSRAQIFCLPSHTEGFPNVILEAMAAGAPILATRVGAIAEMLAVDSMNASGVVVEPHDPQALAEQLRLLMDNPESGRLYGENARKRVCAEYDFPKVLNLLINLWNG